MTPNELRSWRKEHGYSQQRLSDVLGVNRTTLARWEIGYREIPSFLHLALAKLECMKGGEEKSGENAQMEVKDDG